MNDLNERVYGALISEGQRTLADEFAQAHRCEGPREGGVLTMRTLTCDWREDCTNPISHVGSKGYLYCTEHVPNRRGVEGTRRLRAWEIRALEAGEQISYKTISQVEHAKRRAERQPRLVPAAKIWLTWTCDNTDEHPDIEHNVEEVRQQLTDVAEVGGAVCPQCDMDMTLNPYVEVRS